MAERIKIEIDSEQLDMILAKLEAVTTGGVGVGIGGASEPRNPPRISSAPTSEGDLPSIPRGLRTTIGQIPGGYGLVSTYQKTLWLQRSIDEVAAERAIGGGISMASVAGLYTFAILMVVDILHIIDAFKRNIEQHEKDIMALSDIHNSITYQQWDRLQNNPYRGRKG